MKYSKIVEGKFISRPNRFIAEVDINGEMHECHVKNTGRCKELLIKDAVVYLEKSKNPKRRTAYSLIAVKKGNRLVNIDSQAPNKVFSEALSLNTIQLPGLERVTCLKAEKTYGTSRFDFYLESGNNKAFVEVKGVTLEEGGVAKFPDAPTERGVKHIKDLIHAQSNGYAAFVVFILQMDEIRYFTPNDVTHEAFGKALRVANQKGIGIYAYECAVKPDSIEFNGNRCEIIL